MAQVDNSESECEEDDLSVIVIDNGSYSIKAGFAGDDKPTTIFPSTVARPKLLQEMKADCYIGNQYADNDPLDLNINNPMPFKTELSQIGMI